LSSDEPRRPPVSVKLKRGSWEIEITAPEDRVQQAVESVLAGMSSREPVVIEQALESTQERHLTCRDVLLTMWREGWFAEPKLLSQVDEELNRRGYHYDRSAVSHILSDLMREGIFSRDGNPRGYRYVQKRPLQSQ
jgi:hypothetical protein